MANSQVAIHAKVTHWFPSRCPSQNNMDSASVELREKALHYISRLETVDPQVCESNPVMDALLLRTMINEAPSEDGSMNVIEDICDLVEENNEDVRCLSVLADYWENSLLRPSMVPSLSSDLLVMQKFSRAAPHPSRDESDVLINIESATRNQSSLRVKAFVPKISQLIGLGSTTRWVSMWSQ